jgi:CheY-like chemotaxis protein
VSAMPERSVLIVDGCKDTADMLEFAFGAAGLIVHQPPCADAADRYEAIDRAIHALAPDAILFDVALPYDENLLAFTRMANAGAFATTPVIVTTTNVRVVSGLNRELSLGLYDVVEKPYRLEVLMRRVSSAIAGSTPRDACRQRPMPRSKVKRRLTFDL